MLDARDRRIGVAPGILGKQLVRREPAVGAEGDDIGERAAAVDPELPAAHERRFRSSETACMVSAMRGASSGIAWEDSMAMTSSFARSMKRFWPWMPMPNRSGALPSSTYHLLRYLIGNPGK